MDKYERRLKKLARRICGPPPPHPRRVSWPPELRLTRQLQVYTPFGGRADGRPTARSNGPGRPWARRVPGTSIS